MIKTFVSLFRGAVFSTEQKLRESHAIPILEERIRTAELALNRAKSDLAGAIAHERREQREAAAARSRIVDLENRAAQALNGGREDLARETAAIIADIENSEASRATALAEMERRTLRLRGMVEDGERRLAALKRGLATARASVSVRNASAASSVLPQQGEPALKEAEEVLQMLIGRVDNAEEVDAIRVELDRPRDGAAMAERLAEAGFGERTTRRNSDILDRIRKRAAETTIAA